MLQDKDLKTAVLKLIQNQTVWTNCGFDRARTCMVGRERCAHLSVREPWDEHARGTEYYSTSYFKSREDDSSSRRLTRAEFERGEKDNLYTAPGSVT